MIKWLKWLWYSLLPSRPRPYITEKVEELPDIPKENVLYVLGENEHLWSAAIICPCGCRELLQLSLHPEGHPKWTVQFHHDQTASLHPSVRRTVGCQSHFFLIRGKIKWCE